MSKGTDLLKDNIFKLFIRYLTTSAAGMLMISMYILFDTIIVGQGMGKTGLAALNIALPVYNVLFGTGLLLGTGGAAIMAICLGSGEEDSAQKAFSHSIILAAVLGMLYSILGSIFLEPIAYFLGATVETMPFVKSYLSAVMPFSWSFVMVYCLSVIVRNDHGPRRVMLAMAMGGITNVILDYIFVFPMQLGMWGAAAATVISSLVSLVILLLHFVKGRSRLRVTSIKLQTDYIKRIMTTGSASFILELSSGIVIFMFNQQILALIGEIGVSAYSIIANASLMCMAVLSGIAQGIQPLVSYNFGGGRPERVKQTVKMGIVASIACGVVFLTIGMLAPQGIVSLFTSEKGQLVTLTGGGIILYFIAFPFMGINVLTGAYFQAIEQARYSTLISLCRGILFTAIGLKLLSSSFGIVGVWLTVPAAEIATLLIIAIALGLKHRRKRKQAVA